MSGGLEHEDPALPESKPVSREEFEKLRTVVDFLTAENQALKIWVKYPEDPAVRWASKTATVITAGSLGWWGSAFGLSKGAETFSAITIPEINSQVVGAVVWILGSAAVAWKVENVVKDIVVRYKKTRFQAKQIADN